MCKLQQGCRGLHLYLVTHNASDVKLPGCLDYHLKGDSAETQEAQVKPLFCVRKKQTIGLGREDIGRCFALTGIVIFKIWVWKSTNKWCGYQNARNFLIHIKKVVPIQTKVAVDLIMLFRSGRYGQSSLQHEFSWRSTYRFNETSLSEQTSKQKGESDTKKKK